MLPPPFIFHLLVYISLLQTDENYRNVCSGSETAKVEADGLMGWKQEEEDMETRSANMADIPWFCCAINHHNCIIWAAPEPQSGASRTGQKLDKTQVINRVRTMKTSLVQLTSSFSSKGQTFPELQQI